MQKQIRPNLTALVVYNKPSICWYLARRLKEMGFDSVIEAKDSETAMSRLRFATLKGIDVGVIVSDAGVEFIKSVRDYPAFNRIPIVLLGNFSELNAKFDRDIEDIICVLNPVNSDDFKDKVQEALSKSNSSV